MGVGDAMVDGLIKLAHLTPHLSLEQRVIGNVKAAVTQDPYHLAVTLAMAIERLAGNLSINSHPLED